MIDRARWLARRDCLHDLYRDLACTATRLDPWDADAREGWLAACAQLLAAVPDRDQRAIWTVWLAESFNVHDLPLQLVAQELWQRAEERACSKP